MIAYPLQTQVLLIGQEEQHPGINIPGPGSHDQSVHRSESHGGIHGFSMFNGGN